MGSVNLPTGAVTFLFTDIEESTKLWDEDPGAMREALAQHNELLHKAIKQHGGEVFKTVGDAFCAVFAEPPQAVACALEAQKAFLNTSWQTPAPLRVRIAIHSGEAEVQEGDYLGPSLNLAARLLSIGRGGQILLSEPAERLSRERLPEGTTLRELGEHRLRGLSHPVRIFQLTHPLLPREFPLVRSLRALVNNLPLQLTSFVGREPELEEIKRLLDASRLLTLTGAGGIGKTRLALKAGESLLQRYPDGVWLVEFAAVSDPTLVSHRVASTLGIHEEANRPLLETLLDYLYPKKLLLIFDNCEHVISVCASLVETLLRACPDLRILATSREPLGIGGETVWRVPSLTLPEPKKNSTEDLARYDALTLFVERARLAQPSFALHRENSLAVVEICRQLDGVPLAIELAAARVKMFPVEQIGTRLKNRFNLLTGGKRTALPRHQTLEATIDWSYLLLTHEEQVLFLRLSTFRGGFTFEMAQAVCAGGEVLEDEFLDRLARLVDKSLVLVEEGTEEEARYRMLETIRQYAEEKLGETPSEREKIRTLHAEYFSDFLRQREPNLKGAGQREALDDIRHEIENVQAAWEWTVRQKKEEFILGALESLYLFYQTRSRYSEGEKAFEFALEGLEKETTLELTAARLRARLAVFKHLLSNYGKARELLEQSLAVVRGGREPGEVAFCLNQLGAASFMEADSPRARSHFEESLRIYREIDDHFGAAKCLNDLGDVAYALGNFTQARDFFQESLRLREQAGEKFGMARALNQLGLMVFELGEYAEAERLCKKSLIIREEIGDRRGAALSLDDLAKIALVLGEYREARRLLEQSLAISKEIGYRIGVVLSLNYLGIVAFQTGEYEEARQRLHESLKIQEEIRYPWGMIDCLTTLGNTARAMGEYEESKRHLGQALKIALDVRAMPLVMHALLGAAQLLHQEGKPQGAWELVLHILEHPATNKETRDKAILLSSELKQNLSGQNLPGKNLRTLEESILLFMGEASGQARFISDWA